MKSKALIIIDFSMAGVFQLMLGERLSQFIFIPVVLALFNIADSFQQTVCGECGGLDYTGIQ